MLTAVVTVVSAVLVGVVVGAGEATATGGTIISEN
jgi:hypothetical protein